MVAVRLAVLPEHNGPFVASAIDVPLTDITCVAGVPQPVEYIMVAEPLLTPVTAPDEVTVAIAELLVDHAPPAGVHDNVVTPPTHTDELPVMVPGELLLTIRLLATPHDPMV